MTPKDLLATRVRTGRSQRDLAHDLGVEPNTVARWERTERPIPLWVDKCLAGWAREQALYEELVRLQHRVKRLQRKGR